VLDSSGCDKNFQYLNYDVRYDAEVKKLAEKVIRGQEETPEKYRAFGHVMLPFGCKAYVEDIIDIPSGLEARLASFFEIERELYFARLDKGQIVCASIEGRTIRTNDFKFAESIAEYRNKTGFMK